MPHITVKRLSNALGAEVSGVDLRNPLPEPVVAEIRQAWLDHVILLFRGEPLTHEQHIAFSRQLGALETHDAIPKFRHPDHHEILLVTNFENTGKRLIVGRQWHSDLSTLVQPAMGSLLHCHVAPPVGGDTMFANMYRAWDNLSPAFQDMLRDRWALHDMSVAKETRARRTPEELAALRRKNPPVWQPVARRHEETGRLALYVSEMTTTRLEGLTEEESAPILQYLFQQSVLPENTYRHRWQPGDLILWDNRCAMHMALSDYDENERRVMYRTTLLGVPTGRVAEAA